MDKLIIQKTLRVPAVDGAGTELVVGGSTVAMQLDATLIHIGFKASGPLLEHISTLSAEVAMDRALTVLGAVRELVGDHVAHNVYFIDFPRNVPNTIEFWMSCLRTALTPARTGRDTDAPSDAELLSIIADPAFNLLALPAYGRYQHTYAEMLAAHETLIPSVKDRLTVLHLGDSLDDELAELYCALVGSTTPLGEADLAVLEMLASMCLDVEQPESVPVREHRAVVNAVRLAAGRVLVGVDTVTDVLRLACQVSDGDVTLATPTRFRAFSRAERRAMMTALDAVVSANPAKLGDVNRYAERWKRLGERIYPGNSEFTRLTHARDVFAVARGDKVVQSLAGRVEVAFATGRVRLATRNLATAPGMLFRSLDRVLREAQGRAGTDATLMDDVLAVVETAVDKVSGRVLLSVTEHLKNRHEPAVRRMFANRGRRAWVTEDTRPPLSTEVIARARAVIGADLARRLPELDQLVVEEEMLGVALPLSGAASEDGFGVLPRGSTQRVDNDVLRLFMYWRENKERTDYDLSALFLDKEFRTLAQVSYTNIDWGSVLHSGDITGAAAGASEFIDIPLRSLDNAGVAYIVPEINVYSGESFEEVAESMVGFMTCGLDQRGAPFEAATVRTRSVMRGAGRVALPMVFMRGEDGAWVGKYLHLYLAGSAAFNRVEGNHRSVGLLARAMVARRSVTVSDLVDLWTPKVKNVTVVEAGGSWEPDSQNSDGQDAGSRKAAGQVTYIGVTQPAGLPEGWTVVTADTLNALVPE